MQTVLGLFICLVILSAGSALECETCFSAGGNCTGRLQTCDAGKDTCTIVLTVNTMDRDPYYSIIKGCGSSSECRNGPLYLTVGPGKQQRASITCCVGNACNTVKPQLPPVITKTNGKRCPACYSVSEGSAVKCNKRETVNCVGPEDKCLDVEMTSTSGGTNTKSIFKGCTTQSQCDFIRDRRTSDFLYPKFECKTAPNA